MENDHVRGSIFRRRGFIGGGGGSYGSQLACILRPQASGFTDYSPGAFQGFDISKPLKSQLSMPLASLVPHDKSQTKRNRVVISLTQ